MFGLSVAFCLVFLTVSNTEASVRRPLLIKRFNDGRIVGGENSNIQDFPYQVGINLLGSQICGGSIISPTSILTAGHCVYTFLPASTYSITYGVSNLEEANRDENVIIAKKIARHPQYDSNDIDYDVAVITLVAPIPFSRAAQAIPLTKSVPVAGTPAIVSGWGTLTEGGQLPSILQSVNVEIVDFDKCAQQNQPFSVTSRMLCAGVPEGGKDACQGDSGGPLAVNGELVGVVSWGLGCARRGYPGVYSNVANLNGWIRAQVRN